MTTPTALITGASSGLGEEFARQLARKGYNLVLVARREDLLQRLAQELSQAHGTVAEVIRADLSQPDGVALAEKRLVSGDIDLLVNNAGFGTHGEFARLPLERELEEIDLNVRALVSLSHAAAGSMLRRGRGRIINVASIAAFQPVPFTATYAATKAFVLYFSEGLNEEVRRKGVSVTAVCPGPVKTGFQETAGIDGSKLPIGWVDAKTVVSSALRASEKGRAVCTPGILYGFITGGTRLLPRWLARKLAAATMRNAGKNE